ncbi:hypothetical protein TPB0596_23120 [Tsukamurella pulmonis]|uniref:hypothetical protein n=1 Tax=Tsukamurella pulmonis TaxID=47312 RepID=UPI001EDF3561|nr:hypothetical protein [Tsukamurella pulmonis]BDD82549.1 hypothetical protein TPB0596_23120 [Tsukamurella pulmonis]
MWNLAVALDHLPNEASQGPVIFRFDIPLDETEVPPWWDFFPPALRRFYLNAHRDLNEGVLTMPGSPESTLLASDRFNPDRPEEMCAFQPCPDPRELVIVATNPSDQLYLDIGQQTYQGWEVPADYDERGGPRPVDLLDTIAAYLVLDRSGQADLPETSASEAPRPAPLRPRNPRLDWPNDPFWQRR